MKARLLLKRLVRASAKGDLVKMRAALQAGAEPNAYASTKVCPNAAVLAGHASCRVAHQAGHTPLVVAAAGGHTKAIVELVMAGANVDLPTLVRGAVASVHA